MKRIPLLYAYLLFPCLFSVVHYVSPAQVLGDFQTKNATGNWSDFNSWNIYNGSTWVAAVSGQLPSAAASVFVQTGNVISVDNGFAACKDLNITNSLGAGVSFTSANGILNVNGNFTLTGTANCFPSWVPGAKIVFSGSAIQKMPDNLGTNSVLDLMEVNKSGGTLTSGSSFKFNRFVLTGGNFIVASAADVRGNSAIASININGGTWTQIADATKIENGTSGTPIGTVTINGGTMELATSNKATGFQLSSINVSNGGIFTLDNFSGLINIASSINVDATSTFNTALTATPLPASVTFNGIVNYNNTAAQTITAATYNYLKLSGKGTKTLGAGTTIIPAGGTLEMSGVATSPTLDLNGNILSVSNSGTNLLYTSAGAQTASTNEWNVNFQNITINNASGVSMKNVSRAVQGSLNLKAGIFNIDDNGSLILDGASLNATGGFIDGTKTSDLTIQGAMGGTVTLPLSGNISLRNLTVTGTRTLAMDGMNNINLYGIFNIDANATYDNGGESQITDRGGSINITGKFITRDVQGFVGINSSIPSITPVLNTGSTVEYGLSGDQLVQGTTGPTSYYNVIFSGSGTKTLISNNAVPGTITISGSAIFDASNNTFGGAATNLIMTGTSMYKTAGTSVKPDAGGTYTLGSSTTIEFTNSSATEEIISSGHNYANILVSGNSVADTRDIYAPTTITIQAGGSFTVTGTFNVHNVNGFSSAANTAINNTNNPSINLQAGCTIQYNRSDGKPQQITNGLSYQNLSIAGTGNKNAPSGILTIRGNLSKSGTSTFIHNNGTVLLNGINQTFAGLTYYDLQLTNGTKTTSGSSIIIDSIKINNGTILSISGTPDTITLHSDAVRTARMGQIGTGVINYNTKGKFTVERYIPGIKKAWRFLSVPTNSNETINEAWQEGATASNVGNSSPGSSGNPKGGYGIMITSDESNWATDGFDAQNVAGNGVSIKYYNPGTATYTGITSTKIPFNTSLGGYMTFIRGDRSVTSPTQSATSTTLRTTGQLFTGNAGSITVPATFFQPVNNPYASQIDMSLLKDPSKVSPNNYPAFYVWDPNATGLYGYGAFVTFSTPDGGATFDCTNCGGSYTTGDHIIDNGIAFWVNTLEPGGLSVPLSESVKTSSTLGTSPFTPVSPSQSLRTNLFALDSAGEYHFADGVLNTFGNFSNDIDGLDARKYLNSAENISIVRNNTMLSIERRQTLHIQDSIFLQVNNLKTPANYCFVFTPNKLDAGLQPYLEDSYLKIKTPLHTSDTTVINFSTGGNSGSAASDRFRIVFDAAQGPLPLVFTNVNAYTKNNTIAVDWQVNNQQGIISYEIEKSLDGVTFTGVESVKADNNTMAFYEWIDDNPATGNNYYRVRDISIDGAYAYSNVVKASVAKGKSSVTVYPNPLSGRQIHLRFVNEPAGAYILNLFNTTGQLIMKKQISHSGSISSFESVELNEQPEHGMYFLQIIKPNGDKMILHINRIE